MAAAHRCKSEEGRFNCGCQLYELNLDGEYGLTHDIQIILGVFI